MPADFHLRGGDTDKAALVSQYGELVVSPYDYSDTYFKNFAVAATAYNFTGPITNKFFVMTGLILQANKNVNATTGQIVDIYEADNATSATIDKSLFQFEMIKNDRIVLGNLNLRLREGKFLNGKTEDDDILATVTGYYVSTLNL